MISSACSVSVTAVVRAGVRFGPPGSKRLVYFVDDMNMPFVDKYDTQSAIELIRQSVDYRGWFDKVKIVLKEVTNTQYCACMNPTAGSFNITPRMQRHFVTFAVQMPHPDIVRYAQQHHLDRPSVSCMAAVQQTLAASYYINF